MTIKLTFVDKGTMCPFYALEQGQLFRSSMLSGVEDTYMRVRDGTLASVAINLTHGDMVVFPSELSVIPLVKGQSIILEAM